MSTKILMELRYLSLLEGVRVEEQHSDQEFVLMRARGETASRAAGILSRTALDLEVILDEYLLVLPQSAEQRQRMLEFLFGAIAKDYEAIVDLERNQENIRVLGQMIRQNLSSDLAIRLLDFGCGPGMGHEILAPLVSHRSGVVIGFDPAPEMRARAQELEVPKVWGFRELAAAPDGFFDGVLCSYVLHLPVEPSALRLAWSRLRVGGVLAANFLKGIRSSFTSKLLNDLGARVLGLGEETDFERHGIYGLFQKTKVG